MSEQLILQTRTPINASIWRPVGTLEDWQTNVATYAIGNSLFAFSIMTALSGPLLFVVGDQSGGFHLYGRSRSGKTTCLRVGASVWGRPDMHGIIKPWRATTNAWEGVAAEHCDFCLFLDEMGQGEPRVVSDSIYMLANSSGKLRAGRSGQAVRPQLWRLTILSSGEVSVATKLTEGGIRIRAGQDVRLASIPADAGCGMGVVEALHGFSDSGALIRHLGDAVGRGYGTVGRAWLQHLVNHRAWDESALVGGIRAAREEFLRANLPNGADAQIRSVGERFALAAAAGEIAIGWRLLPWPEGEAIRASARCFAIWAADRGISPGEDVEALRQVRSFIEQHGSSRFEMLGNDEVRVVDRVGFRRRNADGFEYLVLPEAWQTEVCAGLDPKQVADVLIAKGFLLGATDRHRAALVKIGDHGKLRVYRISGSIIGDAADQTVSPR
jgi:putative DNA primase/helicase